MRKKQQILGAEIASLPGRGVLLIWLVMLVSLGMAASGCGTATVEPTKEREIQSESVIVWFDPEVTAQLEYEGEPVPLSWGDTDYLVVPLTPEAGCDPEENCGQIVMDFKVVEDQGLGEGNPTVYEFDPPLKIEVPYTADDVTWAGGLNDLTLRYWDEGTWVAFTKDDHLFRLEGDAQGGWGYAQISEWSDREIAWGGPD